MNYYYCLEFFYNWNKSLNLALKKSLFDTRKYSLGTLYLFGTNKYILDTQKIFICGR